MKTVTLTPRQTKALKSIEALTNLDRAGCGTFLKINLLLCLNYRADLPIPNIVKTLNWSKSGIMDCLHSLERDGLTKSRTVHTGSTPAFRFSNTERGEKLIQALFPDETRTPSAHP